MRKVQSFRVTINGPAGPTETSVVEASRYVNDLHTARAEERERCARVCEDLIFADYRSEGAQAAKKCAERIRALPDKEDA